MMQLQRLLPLLLAGLGTAALFRLVLPPMHTEVAPPISSQDCQSCHPAVWEEWQESHHAFAFQNPEVRRLSQNFLNEECLACHAPRPVLQFKPGERVLARQSDRSLGVDCLSCHSRPEGGVASAQLNPRTDAACAPTTDLRLTSVDTCGSCHNQHGTVEQWRAAPEELQKENCLSCHMKDTFREGGRRGRVHSFPAAHDLASLQEAVALEASFLKGQVHLQLTNHGAGHNFPTDERSRAADLQWRSMQKKTWGEWQQVYRFRDPYRDEIDLNNTQLPAGKTWETTLHPLVPPDAVEVRLLYRTNPFQPDDEASVLQTISLLPGEGKTSISKDLAPPPSINQGPSRQGHPTLVRDFGKTLPVLSQKEREEILAWKELWEASFANGNVRLASPTGKALRKLQELHPTKRMAAILHWVEEKNTPLDIQRWAYAWWAKQPYEAGIPRMILRLKYEKDPDNVLSLAVGLLKLGEGAGLAGLLQVMTFERFPQVQTLLQNTTWTLETAQIYFQSQKENWDKKRSLKPSSYVSRIASPELLGEMKSMLHRFLSQPLRPVDDARFVFTRMSPAIYPSLLSGIHQDSLYMQEHCLQTMAWLGEPFGRWIQRTEIDRTDFLKAFIQPPPTRTRRMEAVGAIGLPEGEALLLPWLTQGNREEQTAAADALLRCATLPLQNSSIVAMEQVLENVNLSDEARFSLQLIQSADASPPSSLDSAEVDRRRRWLAQRWWTQSD